jgi:hypothetical protein
LGLQPQLSHNGFLTDGALVGAGSTTLLGVGHLALSQFPSLCGSCNDNNNNNNMRRRYTCVLF